MRNHLPHHHHRRPAVPANTALCRHDLHPYTIGITKRRQAKNVVGWRLIVERGRRGGGSRRGTGIACRREVGNSSITWDPCYSIISHSSEPEGYEGIYSYTKKSHHSERSRQENASIHPKSFISLVLPSRQDSQKRRSLMQRCRFPMHFEFPSHALAHTFQSVGCLPGWHANFPHNPSLRHIQPKLISNPLTSFSFIPLIPSDRT